MNKEAEENLAFTITEILDIISNEFDKNEKERNLELLKKCFKELKSYSYIIEESQPF